MNPQKVHENILGLEYLEGTFTNEELQQISNLLETNGITFLSHSKESRPIAGIDILFPQIQAFLSNDLVQSIALGLLTDVMYDALKAFPKLVRKLSQGKPFLK